MNNLELLADALAYMEENLCETITAEAAARNCFCSKSCLEKLFRSVYGCSVKEYVIKRRMTKAAKELIQNPEKSVLDIALSYGYQSHEAFTRAFEQSRGCSPTAFRSRNRFTDIFPRLQKPFEKGDAYMKQRKPVDISELYDLFLERRDCYFICCDIKGLVPINEISVKAGDLAILEAVRRMESFAAEDDIVFRIGGDEFALLTNSRDISYARRLAELITGRNGETICFEGREIPLSLYATVTRFEGKHLKYDELFVHLHQSILESK